MSERGSGRTSRQLAALPDGAWYLVPHRPAASHCERLLARMGRDRRSIAFITPDISRASICGQRPSAWDVDHSFFQVAGRSRAEEAYDLLWMASGKAPLSGE